MCFSPPPIPKIHQDAMIIGLLSNYTTIYDRIIMLDIGSRAGAIMHGCKGISQWFTDMWITPLLDKLNHSLYKHTTLMLPSNSQNPSEAFITATPKYNISLKKYIYRLG